jgi:hypothetical protein
MRTQSDRIWPENGILTAPVWVSARISPSVLLRLSLVAIRVPCDRAATPRTTPTRFPYTGVTCPRFGTSARGGTHRADMERTHHSFWMIFLPVTLPLASSAGDRASLMFFWLCMIRHRRLTLNLLAMTSHIPLRILRTGLRTTSHRKVCCRLVTASVTIPDQWANFSPRSAAFDVFGTGKTILRGVLARLCQPAIRTLRCAAAAEPERVH